VMPPEIREHIIPRLVVIDAKVVKAVVQVFCNGHIFVLTIVMLIAKFI
jgi:hypothetical protein